MVRLRDPLFHVVVALGAAAAVGACGDTKRSPGNTSAAAGQNAGGEPTGVGGGGVGGVGGVGGGEGAQLMVAGVAGASAGSATDVNAAGALNADCAGGVANAAIDADAGAGGASTECPTPQLRCTSYSPTPTDCTCARSAPLSACDCTEHNYKGWSCAVFDPPMGCECVDYITGPK
ncbi:MAG: hypothetical protein ABUL60_31225 [Myxococcales bacterium]